jgi:hypothetical protein
MTLLRPRAALAGAPLLLALALLADELAFRPKADLEAKKTLKITAELKPEKVEMTVNGEVQPKESMEGVDQTSQAKLEVGVSDKYVLSKDGHPVDLRRTFDSLALTWESGSDKGEASKFNELEGKTVRFKWNADSESYDKSFHESKGDESLLEPLSEDMDVRALLPAKKVSDGEGWEVRGDKVPQLFLPGGIPGRIGSGGDAEEAKTVLDEVRQALAKYQEQLKVQCKYKGSRDEGGDRVGEIDFTFSGKGRTDISHLIQSIASMEEKDIHFDVDGSADLDLEGTGVVLWDLEAGRVHSFTMHAEAGVDLDVKVTFEVDGENVEMLAKAHLSGKADWTLAATKP